ncbi:MAG: DUF192 domain-containing protein [Nitrospiria bacterium]
MKSKATFFLVILIFCFAQFTLSLSQTTRETIVILPDGGQINARVADTTHARSTGLMGRSHLGVNEGMLFLFETTGLHRMWMKNMLIPIDIIWLNERKEIVEIARSVPPCLNDPCKIYGSSPSRYVLEMSDGSSALFHLKKGSALKFP